MGDYDFEVSDPIDDEDEDGSVVSPADDAPVNPPRFAPVFTGVLDASGRPIIKHPVVMRMGFWPENQKYHSPTEEMNSDQSVVGWYYQST